ncbi:MAG: peptidase [Ignavibacteriae bacterium HGW-Ignavibacteriae-3]|nr:MAG: peptidase [Ignavibacteriae bacterium HGW-Ignavibacteriae-3]
MKTKLASIYFFVALFVNGSIFPQNTSLNIPVNIQKAIDRGTRSLDGRPGPNYWQNKAEYKIKAELAPKTRIVTGEETIFYYNNSPDTLKQLVIKILPDLFRRGNMRDFQIYPNDLTDGVQFEKIIVDGGEIKADGSKNAARRDGTNLFIPLSKPMASKSKMELQLNWSFIIPKESNVRMGTYDSTSFFVAYWFPQVAVYDDIDGWDNVNYTGHVETYNDFSNYEVELTVPKNFIVWGTGILQNPKEVLAKEIFERYKKANGSDVVIKIVEEKDYKNGIVTADSEKLTYKFKADYVPDFAFATSDHYLWDGSSLIVDKQSGRRTFISAAYKKESKDFYTVAIVARKAIESFSTHLPGIPFPYPQMTVFNGEGGMEFPMMVNDSSEPELRGTVHLTSHEISHTYFPFYMGINERKYAWMDEGWATMLPFDFQTANAPGYDPRTRNAQSFSEFAGNEQDVPPMVLSYLLRGSSYRTASYRRPGAAYEFLRQMLGDELFKKSLHEFMSRWNGKHPIPFDFFFSFNSAAGRNLDWYFNPWFFQTKYPDLSLAAKLSGNGADVTITNKGGLPLPVMLKFYYEDGTSGYVYEKNADAWEKGNSSITTFIKTKMKVNKIELGETQIPDVNLNDNIVEFK